MTEFVVSQPEWLDAFLASKPKVFPTLEDRMNLVMEATELNIKHKTGGPFGSAVFELNSGKLVAVGVNSVMRHGWSGAHAEAMAIIFASKAIGSYDLGGPVIPEHQLVVNGQPCAMCFGTIIWSGVVEVAWGATSKEIEELTGFDEGPLTANYVEELENRGIRVITDVLREENIKVIATYKNSQGIIYNARQGKP
uniref:CMP/dCMP-type deaminase domain-containing protein n=2 Tax=Rhodosorus marinus TaxID=101924 RepID=A0A7S3E6S2_9RHOD|mmetsp:Transcript_10087/g.42392  ORF Transcript_10087/g.42392 Transcript_10087/m.42392 type:complete len:195 (+) Transcript_10087:508-1092(+)|eukprot:CAMPEP_0113960976 /NCGR_PEP_ID=MMETSP0011_2-20120614/5035_1 /TAXON_ID=101924 /ORGANISM="Rhodosorus marinus" /LENGTH=194 /DNA_ID=CAMNT_0000972531 /DNA_START=400 /DNA_END=984 /DNA_ORIENTATION=+ /assembly_acc=CAM_ASM_000156